MAEARLCEFPDEYCPDAGTGRWKNLGVLGSGGLAVVYLAQDMKGSRGRVALKVLRAAAQPVHAYELHREALWSLTRLHCISHSKYDSNGSQLFVRYLEDHTGFDKLCVQDGIPMSFDQRRRHLEADSFDWSALATQKASMRPYVVMEHLPGQMLWDLTCTRARSIKKLKPLSDEETRQILVQLSKACMYLERHGLVHRDLRPCNVQLCRRRPRCQVKVLDLGVMLAAEPSLRLSASPAVCVFRNRTLQDGYDWLPPEVAREGVNFALPSYSFDIFSLGVLWLQLLVGMSAGREVLLQLSKADSWPTAGKRLVGLMSEPAFRTLGRCLAGPVSFRPRPSEVVTTLSPGSLKPSVALPDPAAPVLRPSPEPIAIPSEPETPPKRRGHAALHFSPRRDAKKASPRFYRSWEPQEDGGPATVGGATPSVELTPPPLNAPVPDETPPPPFASLAGAEAALQQMAIEVWDLISGLQDTKLEQRPFRKRRAGPSESSCLQLSERAKKILMEVEECQRRASYLLGQ